MICDSCQREITGVPKSVTLIADEKLRIWYFHQPCFPPQIHVVYEDREEYDDLQQQLNARVDLPEESGPT